MSLNEIAMQNIYNSKKLSELQIIAEGFGIETKIESLKTGKKINKKKSNLIDEIIIFNLNKAELQKSKEKEDYKKAMSSFDEDRIFYDEISTPVFLIWNKRPLPMDESKKKEYLKPENLENKFDITLNFGCFLKFGPGNGYSGDNFYIVGHNKEIIELDLTDHDESMNETQYIVIPRQISKYLKDCLSFFGISKNNHYSKYIREMKRDTYEHSLDDSCVREIFEIGEIELENHDVYLNKKIKNITQESYIQFKYVLDICGTYEYKLECIIPYLGPDNSVLKDDRQLIQGETGIVKTKDFNKLLEIQEKMKTQKNTYTLSKCGPIIGDEDIEWSDSTEIISIKKEEKDDDMNYDAVVKMTHYQYLKTQKYIKKHFAERMKARDETQVIIKKFGLESKKTIHFYEDNVFTDLD